MSNVVMAGSLGEFDVPAVLQAVSLSRQYTLIRLWDEDSQPSGEIRIKAGQVVEAACNTDRGKLAFSSILGRHHTTFRVERMSDPAAFPEPVGSLSSLLLSAASVPPPKATAKAPAKPTVVPLRKSAAAPTLSSPPARSSAPPLGRPTTPPVLRGRVKVEAAPESVATALESLAALDGIVVTAKNDASRAWSWQRGPTPIVAEAAAGFAHAITNAMQASLASVTAPGDLATTMMELGRARLVVEHSTPEVLVVYIFGAKTPLGVVRHCVAQARRTMAGAFSGGSQQAAI